MTREGWLATAIIAVVFVLLAVSRHPPYLILLGGLTAVMLTGVLDPKQAFAGYGNEGLVTVAVLFVVAAGLRQTGALDRLVQRALGRPRNARRAQMRLAPPVMLASAFMNNTPLVAMLIPVLLDWCRTNRIAPSKLLLPLSYFAVLGGTCSLIGTSTNIVVNGLLVDRGYAGFGMFDISWVGVPCALLGGAYLVFVGSRFLPERGSVASAPQETKQYTIEMVVAPGGPLVGKTIEQAGLRRLPSVYLMEIHRGERVIPMVQPTEKLDAGDQLVFVGLVDSVVDLQRIPGLQPATRQLFKLDSHPADRCFVEAVVSQTCPLVGQTIREGRFRNRYDAVVVAVARNGERIEGRIGDIALEPGDSLLLEALPSFLERQRQSRDFYLVSRMGEDGPPTKAQAPIALSILALMVVVVAAGWLPMVQAAFIAAAAMLVTRCCSEETARRAVDWPLLHAIGASFGLGKALETSGAAEAIARLLLDQAGAQPWLALFLIYATAMAASELVTNNAAAIIVFPIAMSTASDLQVNPMPFVVAVMVGASAAFATPLGYQTHLMVYGPGGYRFTDFTKVGLPLNFLLCLVTCSLAPLVWPF